MPKELSYELLLERGVCKGQRHKAEPMDKYLSRQTHLSLDARKLKRMGTALQACPRLEVLYLFDNSLESLEGLNLPLLTHLYVQNNQLREGPELAIALSTMRNLQKLYIGCNQLSDLAPLCVLSSLEELHAGGQRGSGPLMLPPELEQLQRLRVLLVANNGLTDLTPLSVLGSLEKLDASGNMVSEMADVAPMLSRTPRLQTLDLRGCPLSKRRQMLDAVIVCGRSLTELNGREITKSERPYLQALERTGRRTLSPSSGLRNGGPRISPPRSGLGASPDTDSGLGPSPDPLGPLGPSQPGSMVSAGTLDSSPAMLVGQQMHGAMSPLT